MSFHDRRLVAAAIICSFVLLIYGFSTVPSSKATPSTPEKLVSVTAGTSQGSSSSSVVSIPQIVHFIIGARTETSPIELNFLAFLSMYSASMHMPTAQIWLHTNASSSMIDRAYRLEGIPPPNYTDSTQVANSKRDGGVEIKDAEYSEYWTQGVIKGVKNIKIKPITREYLHTRDGTPIQNLANWADFVRADVIYEHGGVFLDLDAVVLRDLTPLMQTGFRNVLARDIETQCGVIIAAPKSNLMRAYRELMDGAYDPDNYAFHAVSLLHVLRRTFARVPNELLMVSDRTFYPITWNIFDPNAKNAEFLWSIHNIDMTEAARQVGAIDDFDYDAWLNEYVPPRSNNYQFESPEGVDLSESYILHVYHSQLRREVQSGRIKDHTHSSPSKLSHGLTLPLVLEANSQFARAVLRIVWHAVANGVVSVQ